MIDAEGLERSIARMAEFYGTRLVMLCAPDVPGAIAGSMGWSSGRELSNIVTREAIVRVRPNALVPPGTFYLAGEEYFADLLPSMIGEGSRL